MERCSTARGGIKLPREKWNFNIYLSITLFEQSDNNILIYDTYSRLIT